MLTEPLAPPRWWVSSSLSILLRTKKSTEKLSMRSSDCTKDESSGLFSSKAKLPDPTIGSKRDKWKFASCQLEERSFCSHRNTDVGWRYINASSVLPIASLQSLKLRNRSKYFRPYTAFKSIYIRRKQSRLRFLKTVQLHIILISSLQAALRLVRFNHHAVFQRLVLWMVQVRSHVNPLVRPLCKRKLSTEEGRLRYLRGSESASWPMRRT